MTTKAKDITILADDGVTEITLRKMTTSRWVGWAVLVNGSDHLPTGEQIKPVIYYQNLGWERVHNSTGGWCPTKEDAARKSVAATQAFAAQRVAAADESAARLADPEHQAEMARRLAAGREMNAALAAKRADEEAAEQAVWALVATIGDTLVQQRVVAQVETLLGATLRITALDGTRCTLTLQKER